MRRSSVTIRLRPSGIGARHSSHFQIRRFRRQPLQQAGTKPLRLAGLWLPSRPVNRSGETWSLSWSPRALRVFDMPPVEPPGTGEVTVRVERAGICGSDIHILHGSNPFARYPRVIGHEFAGVIEAWARDRGLKPRCRSKTVVDPVVACGRCYPCRVGRPNVCANLQVFGVHRDGGFRERLNVPAMNCVPVPDGMPIEVAALAEPFLSRANVLTRTGISPDDTVLIYGAGTVGITVLQVAKLHGARCIVADWTERGWNEPWNSGPT